MAAGSSQLLPPHLNGKDVTTVSAFTTFKLTKARSEAM